MVLFPVGDDNRDIRRPPIVTWLLIAANVLVFVVFQGLGTNLGFTYAFATVPTEILSGKDVVSEGEVVRDPASGQLIRLPGLQPTPVSVYLTLLVSMFMHGGFAHLFGNMLFLWIFGDNLEDRLGRARFLVFYLTCGLLASVAHVVTTSVSGGDPNIPSLGASGAISGVLAGYLVMFPHRRVRVVILYSLTELPAIVMIGLWFLFQVISGVGSLGAPGGGVAYGAHVGGFLAGLLLVRLFAPPAVDLARPVVYRD